MSETSRETMYHFRRPADRCCGVVSPQYTDANGQKHTSFSSLDWIGMVLRVTRCPLQASAHVPHNRCIVHGMHGRGRQGAPSLGSCRKVKCGSAEVHGAVGIAQRISSLTFSCSEILMKACDPSVAATMRTSQCRNYLHGNRAYIPKAKLCKTP
jgi:hypothetical protein